MEDNSYFIKIRRLILSQNSIVTEVRNLNFVRVLNYSQDFYLGLLDRTKRNGINEIEQIQAVSNKSSNEDLIIMKFDDQNSISYIAFLYDNDRLWQDPELLIIIPQLITL